MLEERRQHPRLIPSAPMFVSLDASKSGLLLDVCAGGIAIASLIPRKLEDVVALEFELPEGCGLVSTNAEIAWTRDNGHLSGARFVNLDEDSRAQLSRWIGASGGSVAEKPAFEERAVAKSEVLEFEVEATKVVESELVQSEFGEPEFAEQESAEPGSAEQQASLFHPEAVENRSEVPAETHPVDAYFLEPPTKEHSEAKSQISDEPQAPAREEPEVVSGAQTQETDSEERALAKRAEFDQLVCEAETAEAAAEQREAISTYTQAARVAEDEDETHMHLARAAVFVEEAKPEDVAHEPAKEWLMRPWNIPRTAGLQILNEPSTRSTAERSRHTIEIILAVVVLSWALVFLGYQMGSKGVSRQSPRGMDATTVGAGAAEDASKGLVPSVEASPGLVDTRSPSASNGGTRREAAARPLAKKESASASTLGDPGIVLQVGAMKLEDNADSLARELQKRNLPAFVFRHGSDRLYRVAVGPFSDEQATEKAKTSLEKQGLKPILRRWLPD
jgi:cell division septation protein DedD